MWTSFMGALPTSFSLAKKGGMRTAEWKEGNDERTVEGFQFEVPNLWDVKKYLTRSGISCNQGTFIFTDLILVSLLNKGFAQHGH